MLDLILSVHEPSVEDDLQDSERDLVDLLFYLSLLLLLLLGHLIEVVATVFSASLLNPSLKVVLLLSQQLQRINVLLENSSLANIILYQVLVDLHEACHFLVHLLV